MLIRLTEKTISPISVSVLVFLLFVAFEVQFMAPATSVSVKSAVGVKVGDWGKYDLMVTFASDNPNADVPPDLIEMNNTEWVKNVVVNISDTKITFERVVHYKDDRETRNVEYVDVSTGESSPDGVLMFIPSNLGKDDLVHGSSFEHYSINETIRRTYAERTRDINHLNVSTTLSEESEITIITANYYWDKATGILCERPGMVVTYDGTYTTLFTMSERIVETNIWVGEPDTQPPVADAGQDQTVTKGASVTFDASDCSDNVGIVSYEWDFGDGKTGTGLITTHTYTKPGFYIVTLKVKDAAGNLNIDKMTVNVEESSPSPIVGIFVMTVLVLICSFVWIWKKRKRRH